MGIPDHLTCHLRNLYAGQEATIRTRHGTMDWFKIEKGVHQVHQGYHNMLPCEMDHKEGWAPKNWCFQIVVLERTLESLLDCKEIKLIIPKRNQFIGRTDAEAPILWSPDVKSQFIGKDLDAGKDWGQEEKGTTADEMVAWIINSKDMSLSNSGR